MDESDEFNFFEAEDFDDINALSSVLHELQQTEETISQAVNDASAARRKRTAAPTTPIGRPTMNDRAMELLSMSLGLSTKLSYTEILQREHR